MTESVETQIRQFVVANFLFGEAELMPADDASLLQQGIIDSTGVLSLLMFMEEAFELSVPDEDITPAHFDSVRNLAAYARNRLAMVTV